MSRMVANSQFSREPAKAVCEVLSVGKIVKVSLKR